MTTKDALKNIIPSIDLFQTVLIDCTKTNRNSKRYVISVAMVNLKISIKINTPKLTPIVSCNVDYENATNHIFSLLKKYNFRVEGITYIYHVYNKEFKIDVFNESERLAYSFLTVRKGQTLSVNYKVHLERVNFDELINDWQDMMLLVYQRPPTLKVILANPSLLAYVRMKKLKSVGIE
ncbi:MAG: hypothetical protein AB9846_02780 [Tenuifilaceae bacterium]